MVETMVIEENEDYSKKVEEKIKNKEVNEVSNLDKIQIKGIKELSSMEGVKVT
jgi:hypothetical protein